MFDSIRFFFGRRRQKRRPPISKVVIEANGRCTTMWTTNSDAIYAGILDLAEKVAATLPIDTKFCMKLRAIPSVDGSFKEHEWLAPLVLINGLELVGTYQMPQTDGNVQSEYYFQRKEPLTASI